MTSLVHKTHGWMPARAYCGMWITDCPLCRNAERIDRFQAAVACSYCDMRIGVIWPAEDTVHSIERLLLMRPIPYTQNWNPDETVHDLLQENIDHGVFNQLEAYALENTGPLLSLVGDSIKIDNLPVTKRREMQEIT